MRNYFGVPSRMLAITVWKRFFIFYTYTILVTTAFVERPTTVMVAPGMQATFRCRHHAPATIGWIVNGTSINQLPNQNIIPGIVRNDCGQSVDNLSIATLPEYNGTQVMCVAIFSNGSSEVTPTAELIIQEGLNDSKTQQATTTNTTSCMIMSNGFIEVPSPAIVAVGSEAVFVCSHSNAHLIEWRLNGTLLGDYHPPFVVKKESFSSSENRSSTLIVQAEMMYNETVIQCGAVTFMDEARINQNKENTSPVILLIQGPLSSVGKLMLRNSSLLWDPPFSLNLTDIETDISYCVDVYNISCSSRQHLFSDCNVSEPSYPHDLHRNSIMDLFEYIVVPRSNVLNARNGTSAILREEYLNLNASNLVPIVSKSTSAERKVHLTLKHNFHTIIGNLQKLPHSYSIQLQSIDSAHPTSLVYYSSSTQMTEDGMLIHFNDTFQPGRQWHYTISAAVCEGVPLSNTGHLSTHEVQNINIHQGRKSDVIITSEFINGSQATGVFAIAYSLEEDSNVHYTIGTRLQNQQRAVVRLQGVPGHTYNISVFTLLSDGLPFTRAADVPKLVTTSKLKGIVTSEGSSTITECVAVEGHASSTSACFKCDLMENFVGTCVAIAHPKTSFLMETSPRGLSDISVVCLNKSSGSFCSGCVDGITFNDHVVMVFVYYEGALIPGSGMLVTQPAPSGGFATWLLRVAVSAALVTTVIVFTVLAMIAICVIIARRRQTKAHYETKKHTTEFKKCLAYEVTKLREPHMEQNPAYEETTLCYGHNIVVKKCSAYESSMLPNKDFSLGRNPSYEHRDVEQTIS